MFLSIQSPPMDRRNSIPIFILIVSLIACFLIRNADVSDLIDFQIIGPPRSYDGAVLNSVSSSQLELPVFYQTRDGDVLNWESGESRALQPLGSQQKELEVVSRSPSRRLHSHTEDEPRTALVALLDGTIQLVDRNLMGVRWAFDSGPPIYSSYQAQSSSGYFIYCGDDWDLYEHSDHFGRRKIPSTIAEYVDKKTPKVEEDGSVTLGHKKVTFFEVGLFTGKVYRSYTLSEDHVRDRKKFVKPSLINGNAGEPRIVFFRIDYYLVSYHPYSEEVSWNMTIAEIRAAIPCKDIENLIRGSKTGSQIALPFDCQSKALVKRERDHGSLEHQRAETVVKKSASDLVVPLNKKDLVVPSKPEVHNMFLHWSKAFALAFLFVILMGFVVYHFVFLVNGQKPDPKASPSKRKKSRKLGKNGIVERKEESVLSQDEEALTHTEGDNKILPFLNKLFDGGTNGRRIGKLVISSTEISKGSNGTIVLEGVYEGRPVAVKRLVLAHHDMAFKEIQNLIASDRHPNIVRWYGVDYDKDFVYISLERCICNLDDLIQICPNSSQNPVAGEEDAKRVLIENEVRLKSLKNIMSDVNLWKIDGFPSLLLLKLMRDVVSGLVHLHEMGIIHRDLKPQNVLLIKERTLCAKLSDMGISKRLIGDMSSLGHLATGNYLIAGCGSSGWQAPEQLLHGRQTRAVDMFSLGCLLFYCITGGRHPFGDQLERDINIVKNQMDLFLVEHIPEAVDLISRLLNPDPEIRPKVSEVLLHPLFWNSETRLSFLRDSSDRVELEDREANSGVLRALESIAPIALGGKWDEKMEPAFLTNIGNYRRYKFDSVRDLLRVIRNKSNHYRELPNQIQELVGPVPEGFDFYFASRFPRLLIEVYKVVCQNCREEECFGKYFKSNAD
ncbi:hypothetical protein ACFX2C_026842 [Malus domestica]